MEHSKDDRTTMNCGQDKSQEWNDNSSPQNGINISSIRPYLWFVIGFFYVTGLVMLADGDEDVITTLNKIGAGGIFVASVLQMVCVVKSKKIWPQILAGILIGIAFFMLIGSVIS